MNKRLLIIEDDVKNSESLAKHFTKKHWHVDIVDSLTLVKDHLMDDDFCPDVILADLDVSANEMFKNSDELQKVTNFSEWIFTHDPEKDINVDEIDDLAYDILEKPIKHSRLEVAVNRAHRLATINRRLIKSSNTKKQLYQVDSYLGQSEAAKHVRETLSVLAEAPISAVTIVGETGSGKGLAARIIHHSGLNSDGPLIELNCAALPKELLESQLFGHEKGAFTGANERFRGLFEQAHGGTLFLDEIGDMDLDLQAKLLKALEDKKARRIGGEREISFDVQIIAATGVDLGEAMHKGEFRDDLYHRLNVFCVSLPSLSQRKEDLVELVPNIIKEYNSKANKHVTVVTDEVWEQLFNYSWPGNIRELRNVIERSVLLSKDEVLPAKWLQLTETCDIQKEQSNRYQSKNSITIHLDGSMNLDEMDSFIIQTALEQNDYNVSQTSDILGTTRETLRYRIQKYNLKDKVS
ncbi:MAG: sigma-54-dependent Fis family transcriptional regulator [Oleispira antarctica]|nr:sigma-54-dependent Fis family transcriptional regulator [Oleispira antarctica]MBQ0793126.1 sigma-54-dependent Fis family transcriptional regulator [Oleispira antarctica]